MSKSLVDVLSEHIQHLHMITLHILEMIREQSGLPSLDDEDDDSDEDNDGDVNIENTSSNTRPSKRTMWDSIEERRTKSPITKEATIESIT